MMHRRLFIKKKKLMKNERRVSKNKEKNENEKK